MSARIVVVHDDVEFLTSLAASLRDEGHEVETYIDQAFVPFPPKLSDKQELTIYRATGTWRGLRVRITGVPAGQFHAGLWVRHLVEPANVADVVQTVRFFVD